MQSLSLFKNAKQSLFEVSSFTCELAVEFAFTDKTAAQQSKEYYTDHESKSLVGGPAIRVPDNPGSCWVEGFDKV
jgi:hypothetical protein